MVPADTSSIGGSNICSKSLSGFQHLRGPRIPPLPPCRPGYWSTAVVLEFRFLPPIVICKRWSWYTCESSMQQHFPGNPRTNPNLSMIKEIWITVPCIQQMYTHLISLVSAQTPRSIHCDCDACKLDTAQSIDSQLTSWMEGCFVSLSGKTKRPPLTNPPLPHLPPPLAIWRHLALAMYADREDPYER